MWALILVVMALALALALTLKACHLLASSCKTKTNAGSKILLFNVSFKMASSSAPVERVHAERVDHAAKPCMNDGIDAWNIGAVALQQWYVTDKFFLKTATLE